MNKPENAVFYVHGAGGSAAETSTFCGAFKGFDTFGSEYADYSPWEARDTIKAEFERLEAEYKSVTLIANSIGAYFSMLALSDKYIEKAFFISPMLNMEKVIGKMMADAGVTEDELRCRGEIKTGGNELSWKYLMYVRDNPVKWDIPTEILCGENDTLALPDVAMGFASRHKATVTVMKNGEHWFHTDEQMNFYDGWIKQRI